MSIKPRFQGLAMTEKHWGWTLTHGGAQVEVERTPCGHYEANLWSSPWGLSPECTAIGPDPYFALRALATIAEEKGIRLIDMPPLAKFDLVGEVDLPSIQEAWEP